MREKLSRLMQGRYGPDALGQFLNIVTLVLLVLGIFLSGLFTWIGLATFVFASYRMFSRNLTQRQAENAAYLRVQTQVKHWFSTRRQRFAQRNTYRYFSCPSCKQDIRVPRGKGDITITCPKCQTKFDRKS